MPRQNSINAHPDCRMLYTYTRSWSEPSREVWNVSYDGICVDCARKGPLLISPLSFFSHPCDSHSTPPPKFIYLPCPQQPFEAVLPFLKQITEFLEKLLTWPRSKFSDGSFNLELLCILHLFFFNLQYMPKFFSLTPSALCPLARSSSQSLPACGKAIADCSQSFPAPM